MERASIKVLGVKLRADRSSVAAVMTGNVAIDLYVDVDHDHPRSRHIGGDQRHHVRSKRVKFRADRSSEAAVMADADKQTNKQTDKQTHRRTAVSI